LELTEGKGGKGNLLIMMITQYITHMLVAIAMIILFLFQMAKLEDSISTNFGKVVVTRKRRKLTCEVQSIAKRSQYPEGQNPRDENTRTN
jgi:flagellar basal body-associated protein FliL